MYTVIVADDEEEIRKGIIRRVDWERVGFQVIGEADNGLDALELVEKLEPDLLMTDIRMPFLSGIDLARQVREVRPTVQIAFLSGFDDFAYAQQAIQYNIISYMLKPISSQELELELINMKKIIDGKFASFISDTLVQEEMKKSEFLFSLFLDSTWEKETELIVNAISCDLLREGTPEVLTYIVLTTQITDQDGRNITTRSNIHAVDMILKKYVRYASCYLKGRVVSVIAATPSGFHKYLHILAEEIVQSVERIMGQEALVCVSRSSESLNGCRECYLEAMNAASYSRQAANKVRYIADVERRADVDQEQMLKTVENVEVYMRGGSPEEFRTYLDSFIQQINEGSMSPVIMNFMMMQIVAVVFRIVYAVAGGEDVVMLQKSFPLTEITRSSQMADGMDCCIRLCEAGRSVIAEQRKKSSEVMCDQAIEIIGTRYMDADLSLVAVSSEVAISPNYLSALIRKSTGSTFVEILTQKRIEKARELLLCSSMKIREIAEQCGYRDQHYFSYCFKKATGMSPNSCRRNHGE